MPFFWARTDIMGRNNKGVIRSDKKLCPESFNPGVQKKEELEDMMQDWFRNAKLGIFIHYGIYAVGDVSESWSFHNGNISYEDYMKQCEGFTASKFDAKKWAECFKKAGAQYVVMTAKHHDGVALFDTGYSDLSVVKKTPAARDLVKSIQLPCVRQV